MNFFSSPVCPICSAPSELPEVTSGLCRVCFGTYYGRPIDESGVCRICSAPLLSEENRCQDCSEQTWDFASLRGLFPYRSREGELLRIYKFSPTPSLAPFLARLSAQLLVPLGPLVVVPPLRKHFLRRGWDPVEHFARFLSRYNGVRLLNPLSRRRSRAQKTLDKGARLKNAASSFRLRMSAKRMLTGLSLVWLIDDVVTTGATAQACTKLLLEAGVGEVRVLCLSLH